MKPKLGLKIDGGFMKRGINQIAVTAAFLALTITQTGCLFSKGENAGEVTKRAASSTANQVSFNGDEVVDIKGAGSVSVQNNDQLLPAMAAVTGIPYTDTTAVGGQTIK